MSYSFSPADSDPSDRKSQEKEKIGRIAKAYMAKEITDDNPSDMNGLTSLDQVIHFEFPKIDDLDFDEIMDYIMDECYTLEGNDAETGLVARPFYDDDAIQNRLAMLIIRGIVTDDNHSRWNELTSLEQIIRYSYGKVDYEYIKQVKKEITGRVAGFNGGCNMSKEDSWEDAEPIDFD